MRVVVTGVNEGELVALANPTETGEEEVRIRRYAGVAEVILTRYYVGYSRWRGPTCGRRRRGRC